MSVDFFKEDCLTITNQNKFGICDGVNDAKAFIDLLNSSDWICTVLNENAVEVNFRAVDFCIVILREDDNQERSCDCLLTYPNNIVFIELKNKGKAWLQDGIEQIEKTISFFKANHNLENFRHKRAFVANRRHPNFHVIEDETMKRFYTHHKVRLNVQAEIVIKR